MEALKKKLQNGLKKTNQKNYEAALDEFSSIINEIKGNSEEETEILYNSLQARSACYLFLGKQSEAISDAKRVISAYEDKKTDKKEILDFVSLAHMRLAQVFQAQEDDINALKEFSVAQKRLKENKEFDQNFKFFLQIEGIPLFAGIDKELKLFSDLVDKVTDSTQVLNQLLFIKKEIEENPITESVSARLQSRNVYNIILAYFKLFSDNELIVTELSDLGQVLYSYDTEDWSIVHTLMPTLRKASPFVFGKICNVLKLSTEKGFQRCIDNGLLDILINAADYHLKGAEAESYQLLCGLVCISPEATIKIGQSKIIDYMYSEIMIATMMSIARMTFLPEATVFLEDPSKTEFVFELLKDEELPLQAISAACMLFGRSMLRFNKETKESISYDKMPNLSDSDKNHATKVMEALQPIIAKNTKNVEICANTFMVVAYASRAVPEVAIQLKLHITASLILAIYKEDPQCALNCCDFLLNLVESGHVEDLKTIQALPKNLKIIIATFSDLTEIVEIALCILIALTDNGVEELSKSAAIRGSERVQNYLKKYKK